MCQLADHISKRDRNLGKYFLFTLCRLVSLLDLDTHRADPQADRCMIKQNSTFGGDSPKRELSTDSVVGYI